MRDKIRERLFCRAKVDLSQEIGFDKDYFLFGFYTEDSNHDPMITDEYSLDSFHVLEETLGRSIGIRDKNGTLVFEGDILEQDNKYHPNKGYTSTILISWNGGAWCYSYPKAIDRRYTPNITAYTCFPVDAYAITKHSRVIGDIHDNPELLNAGA